MRIWDIILQLVGSFALGYWGTMFMFKVIDKLFNK